MHRSWETTILPDGHVWAYCGPDGGIGFGPVVPDGQLPICRGSEAAVRAEIEVACRHGYDGVLLVPGLPEAPDQGAALDALHAFIGWRAKKPRPGVDYV